MFGSLYYDDFPLTINENVIFRMRILHQTNENIYFLKAEICT